MFDPGLSRPNERIARTCVFLYQILRLGRILSQGHRIPQIGFDDTVSAPASISAAVAVEAGEARFYPVPLSRITD